MKRILLSLILISTYILGYGQADQNRFPKTPLTGANQNKASIVDYNLKVMSNLYTPKGNSFSLNNGKDSSSALRYQDIIKRLGVYNGSTWDTLAFSKDFINYVKISDGLKRLDSIKAVGLTVTAYAPIQWRIGGVNYQKLTNSVFSINPATPSYNRIDLLYATTSNTVLKLQGSDLSVEYDLSADKYFSAKMIWTGSPTEAPVTINFGTTQMEYNALYELFSCGCGCESKDEKESARFGFIYLKLAEKSVLAGNSAQFNTNISNSYKWLSN